jgi:hypothetical protein
MTCGLLALCLQNGGGVAKKIEAANIENYGLMLWAEQDITNWGHTHYYGKS